MAFLKRLLDTHQISDVLEALDEPLVYRGRNLTIVIPRGFVTDFATIPWIFWAFFPRRGVWDKAAALHDYLLQRLRSKKPIVNARDCDGMFRRVLREEGVAPPKYWMMWTAVRWAALFDLSGHRQAGWWRDAPLVLVWTVLSLPIVLPLTAGVLIALIPYALYLVLALVWKGWTRVLGIR